MKRYQRLIGELPKDGVIISSFSFGESSAYMNKHLKNEYGDRVIDIFANTGLEREETLKFGHKFSEYHGFDTLWLEAVIRKRRKGTSHKIVSYKEAHRGRRLFEDMIVKYGIPNKSYPHCTRELKLAPIYSWIKENIKVPFVVATGIRRDEPNRYPYENIDDLMIYPLWDNEIRKVDINCWFEKQPFRLELHEHQGNCKTCWKKSNVKLAAIMQENPEYFDDFDYFEKNYGLSGSNKDGNKRVFFRGNRSVQGLIEYLPTLKPFVDQYRKRLEWEEDDPNGCSESCEPFQAELFKGYGW